MVRNIRDLRAILDGEAPRDRRSGWLKYASYTPQECAWMVVAKLKMHFRPYDKTTRFEQACIQRYRLLTRAREDWGQPRLDFEGWMRWRRDEIERLASSEGMW